MAHSRLHIKKNSLNNNNNNNNSNNLTISCLSWFLFPIFGQIALIWRSSRYLHHLVQDVTWTVTVANRKACIAVVCVCVCVLPERGFSYTVQYSWSQKSTQHPPFISNGEKGEKHTKMHFYEKMWTQQPGQINYNILSNNWRKLTEYSDTHCTGRRCKC